MGLRGYLKLDNDKGKVSVKASSSHCSGLYFAGGAYANRVYSGRCAVGLAFLVVAVVMVAVVLFEGIGAGISIPRPRP